MNFRIARSDDVTALIDDAGIDALPYENRGGRYRVRLTRTDIARHKDVLLELIKRASGSLPAALDD